MVTRGVIALLVTATLAVAGCSTDPDRTPTGTSDLSTGGECVDGQDVTLNGTPATVNLTGDCGTVTVTASNVHINVAQAMQVVVQGEGTSVLGDDWGSVIVEANGVVLNVEIIGTAQLNADDLKVNNTEIRELRIKGDRVVVNNTKVGVAILHGNDSTIVNSGGIDRLEVYGDRNTVTWSGGTPAPQVDEGGDNTFVR